jgi:hypothetical protein
VKARSMLSAHYGEAGRDPIEPGASFDTTQPRVSHRIGLNTLPIPPYEGAVRRRTVRSALVSSPLILP